MASSSQSVRNYQAGYPIKIARPPDPRIFVVKYGEIWACWPMACCLPQEASPKVPYYVANLQQCPQKNAGLLVSFYYWNRKRFGISNSPGVLWQNDTKCILICPNVVPMFQEMLDGQHPTQPLGSLAQWPAPLCEKQPSAFDSLASTWDSPIAVTIPHRWKMSGWYQYRISCLEVEPSRKVAVTNLAMSQNPGTLSENSWFSWMLISPW
jgi:hypothetical protein